MGIRFKIGWSFTWRLSLRLLGALFVFRLLDPWLFLFPFARIALAIGCLLGGIPIIESVAVKTYRLYQMIPTCSMKLPLSFLVICCESILWGICFFIGKETGHGPIYILSRVGSCIIEVYFYGWYLMKNGTSIKPITATSSHTVLTYEGSQSH